MCQVTLAHKKQQVAAAQKRKGYNTAARTPLKQGLVPTTEATEHAYVDARVLLNMPHTHTLQHVYQPH